MANKTTWEVLMWIIAVFEEAKNLDQEEADIPVLEYNTDQLFIRLEEMVEDGRLVYGFYEYKENIDNEWAISSVLKKSENNSDYITYKHYYTFIQTGNCYEDSEYISLFYFKSELFDDLSHIEIIHEGSKIVIHRNDNKLFLYPRSMVDADIVIYHLIAAYLKENAILTEKDFQENN